MEHGEVTRATRGSLALHHLARCLSKEKVEIHRGDRRALEGGRRVADEHRLELHLV